MDEALGRPHQDAVLALVDSWGKQARAADSAGDELETEQPGSPAIMQKHLPPEEPMDLG